MVVKKVTTEGERKNELEVDGVFTDFLSRETYSENIMLKVSFYLLVIRHSLTEYMFKAII